MIQLKQLANLATPAAAPPKGVGLLQTWQPNSGARAPEITASAEHVSQVLSIMTSLDILADRNKLMCAVFAELQCARRTVTLANHSIACPGRNMVKNTEAPSTPLSETRQLHFYAVLGLCREENIMHYNSDSSRFPSILCLGYISLHFRSDSSRLEIKLKG